MNFVKFAQSIQERLPGAAVYYGKAAQLYGVARESAPGILAVMPYDAEAENVELTLLCGCPSYVRFAGNVIACQDIDPDAAYQAASEVFLADVKLAESLAELLNTFTREVGDHAIIKLLGRLTGRPAVLLDAHFMVLAQSDKAEEQSEYEFRTFSFISEAGQLTSDESESQRLVCEMLVTHVAFMGKTCGYLILQGVSEPVPQLMRELSAATAGLLGRGMATEPAPIATADENILLELLNSTHPNMDLRLRMRGAGLRFDQPKRLVVFDANCDDPLFESVRACLPQGYTTRFKNALVLLIDAAEGPAWDQQREAFARIAEEYQLHVGISDVFSGNMNVSVQCRNAFQAIAFSEQFHIEGALFDYSDFRFFDLLCVFEQPRELFRYMHPALQKLRDIDAKSGAVYFHTLHCFLKYNANLSQTAKALFIHRNTLNYRLKRIEELTGLQLEDHKTRFTLNYSYHIAEFLGLVDV